MTARVKWEKASIAFLRAVVVLVGLVVLAAMLWEPHLEGRNVHSTVFEIYFKDPFLAYVYAGSTAFFVALYNAFKALGYVGRDETFTPETARAARTIKRCGVALVGFVAGAAFFILLTGGEDRPQGIFMCLLAAFGSSVVAASGATLERILRR